MELCKGKDLYQKLLDNLLSLNDVKKISTLISFMGLDENKFLNCDYLKPKLEKNATLVRKRFYE